MIAPDTPLSRIRGIGPYFLGRLKKLGIQTVKDLIFHFPARYEDFSRITKISDLAPNEECTVHGIVKKINMRRAWRKRMFITEAIIDDESGKIRAVWFNQTYIKNTLSEGKEANFSGKVNVAKDKNELYLSNPAYEVIRAPDQDTKHTERIVPIYPETKGLTSKGLRYFIKPLLENIGPIKEIIPAKILKKENLQSVQKSIKDIHFPEIIEDAIAAKRRFAFEDLFLLQLHIIYERTKIAGEKSHALGVEIDLIKKSIQSLPFELTHSQKKSLWEIVKDINRPFPMNRLLQGDVGSGKTIVAALSAIFAAHKGFQTAFMAPTEILARQHYEAIKKFFGYHEDGIALLTASESKIFFGHGLETTLKKEVLKKEIAENKVKVILGTHALLEKDVLFSKLALVIVDEQHRFGVKQRAKLLRDPKNPNISYLGRLLPHFLSMSATPIPRTLSLTLFGDLDLSLITELPKDRMPIITKVVAPKDRIYAYAFIKKQVLEGRQVFVVCPRIEIANNNEYPANNTNINEISAQINEYSRFEVKAVKEEYEKLSKKIFPDLRVAMLHGKIKAREKEKIMSAFIKREIDILVATSVIEVGVDVQNATVMMIEGAERFGLAQLYQFKGRVGRGTHQSYCLLFTESSSRETKSRLLSVAKAKNGLELAEKDLKLRGPGEFLGTTQTGMPDLAMKALQNPEIVKRTREIASELISEDSELKKYPELANQLKTFSKEIHKE